VPIVISDRRYWYLGDIRRWRAEIAGQDMPKPQPDDERMINARQVKDLFGGVSDMWLWRRLRTAPAEVA
jgi:hypothetical protein